MLCEGGYFLQDFDKNLAGRLDRKDPEPFRSFADSMSTPPNPTVSSSRSYKTRATRVHEKRPGPAIWQLWDPSKNEEHPWQW